MIYNRIKQKQVYMLVVVMVEDMVMGGGRRIGDLTPPRENSWGMVLGGEMLRGEGCSPIYRI